MADETSENEEQVTAEEPTATEEKHEEPSELDLLKQKLDEAQRAADLNKDMFLRKAAEFENYKRRTDAEFGNYIRNANEGLIGALIPILNDFVRSLKAGGESNDYDSFYKGVELVHNKFSKVLELQGLSSFDSVGKPFDVEYHDALLQMPREGVPPNTVIEEIERGYKLNDKVLRHAKVIVSTAPLPGNDGPGTQEEVKA